MKLVQQDRFGTCGAACVAMITGETLEAICKMSPRGGYGMTPDEVIDVLMRLGVPAIESTQWPSQNITAILTVPSLNYPGALHYVVWDGEHWAVLDPSNGPRRYPDDAKTLSRDVPVDWASAILVWRTGQ